VGEVGKDQGTLAVGGFGQGVEVEDPAGAVVDVARHHQGRVHRDGGGELFRRFDELEPGARERREALGDVEVGREVAAVGEDGWTIRAEASGGAEELEQVD
jgi:hypothetical protein